MTRVQYPPNEVHKSMWKNRVNKLITCILMVLFCVGCGADTSDATIVEDVLIPVDTASTELGDETGQVDTWADADVSDDDNIPAAGPMMTMLTGETTRGFVDGTGREARFQGITCMTIAPDGSALYVSDTFNGIVRRVDTKTGEVLSLIHI